MNNPTFSNFYQKQGKAYFQSDRPEMLTYIPSTAKIILEVGCGQGNFGRLIKKHYEAEIWGIELNSQAAIQASQCLDRVICDNFEDNLDLPQHYFDCIIFNDVLEHLVEPERTLILARKLLTSSGVIVASIPNVRYFNNLWELLIEADWQYKDLGILDRTHLRFFTRKSMIKLFQKLGYKIQNIEGIHPCEQNYPLSVAPRRRQMFLLLFPWLDKLFRGHLGDMRYQQFAIVAKIQLNKSNAPE